MSTAHPDQRLFLGFCLLYVWAPLPLGSHRPWAAGILAVFAALLAIYALWLYAQDRIRPSPALRQASWALGLFLLLPLWTLLQCLPLPAGLLKILAPHSAAVWGEGWHSISLDPNASLHKLQKSVCYTLCFALALQLLHSTERLQRFSQLLVYCGVFQALYAALVIYGDGSFDLLNMHELSTHARDDNATGTFINRNHLAGYLEMTIAVGIGLLVASLERNQSSSWRERLRRLLRTMLGGKAMLRLFLAAMVIALVLSHSRMGNTAFFASLGIGGLIGLLLYKHASRSVILLFSSLIIIDLFIVGAWFGVEKVVDRLEKTDMQLEGRTFVNEQSLLMIQDAPVVGQGAGSFYSTFPEYRTDHIWGFYDFAHNDYLQLLMEYGLIGCLLFAAIALLSLWQALLAQRKRRTALFQGLGFAAMMGIMALLIHSWTDFNLHIPANAMLFSTLCAFAFIARYAESTSGRRRPSR